MAYWLLKSEPHTWSWDQQKKEGPKGSEWDGVRNFQARKNMQTMQRGDLAFFYHSGEEKSVVGIVKVVAEAHPEFDRPHGRLAVRGRGRGEGLRPARDARGDQGRTVP